MTALVSLGLSTTNTANSDIATVIGPSILHGFLRELGIE
jgi:hypothetical protein